MRKGKGKGMRKGKGKGMRKGKEKGKGKGRGHGKGKGATPGRASRAKLTRTPQYEYMPGSKRTQNVLPYFYHIIRTRYTRSNTPSAPKAD